MAPNGAMCLVCIKLNTLYIMSPEPDKFRRDGRTLGYVSLTRTIQSSILRMAEGFITLVDFPEPIWYSEFRNIPRNKKMWWVIAEHNSKWRLIDYLENEEDVVKNDQW